MTASAYVFCQALSGVPAGGAHSVTALSFTLVQDTRPTTADWPPAPDDGPHVYAVLAIRRACRLSKGRCGLPVGRRMRPAARRSRQEPARPGADLTLGRGLRRAAGSRTRWAR